MGAEASCPQAYYARAVRLHVFRWQLYSKANVPVLMLVFLCGLQDNSLINGRRSTCTRTADSPRRGDYASTDDTVGVHLGSGTRRTDRDVPGTSHADGTNDVRRYVQGNIVVIPQCTACNNRLLATFGARLAQLGRTDP